jgi:hypothetical protein
MLAGRSAATIDRSSKTNEDNILKKRFWFNLRNFTAKHVDHHPPALKKRWSSDPRTYRSGDNGAIHGKRNQDDDELEKKWVIDTKSLRSPGSPPSSSSLYKRWSTNLNTYSLPNVSAVQLKRSSLTKSYGPVIKPSLKKRWSTKLKTYKLLNVDPEIETEKRWPSTLFSLDSRPMLSLRSLPMFNKRCGINHSNGNKTTTEQFSEFEKRCFSLNWKALLSPRSIKPLKKRFGFNLKSLTAKGVNHPHPPEKRISSNKPTYAAGLVDPPLEIDYSMSELPSNDEELNKRWSSRTKPLRAIHF